MRAITPGVAQRLGLAPDTRGVVVASVEPFGAAGRAGLRPGDVVLEVGDRLVESVDDFERAMHEADLERGVRLAVRTGDAQRFVFLRWDEDSLR